MMKSLIKNTTRLITKECRKYLATLTIFEMKQSNFKIETVSNST